jgi:hypothetical protein
VWGNYTFLGIILAATFWHVEEMNFASAILIAHVWILIYIFEPFILPFLGPFGPEAKAPIAAHEQRGPLLRGLQRALVALFMVGVALAGLFFISPEFMTTRWPWELDPFNARIMAAWPGAVGVWAATLYFVRDWAEARLPVLVFIVYGFALFVAFLLTLPQFDMARHNVWTYGTLPLIAALTLLYYYWRQERQAAGRPG